MSHVAFPPPVGLDDSGGSDRLKLRLHQISLSSLTVLATAYCASYGAIPAILALAVAKHLLVAILAMGMGLERPPDEPPPH